MVVHLLRWGTGSDVPWELVGTDDTTFNLATSGYGATGTSPLTVGGVITGVDQNIKVQVRELSSPATIGSYWCLPAAGGVHHGMAPLSFATPSAPVVVIAVQTGRHVAVLECFTVTAVHSGR